jgi:toxin-antitoxin system PIN domain toxin
MSATIDANILVFADNENDPRHLPARELLERLVAGPELLYVFWPVALAYIRLVTRPGIVRRPLSTDEACVNVEALLAPAHVRTASEGERFWPLFRAVAESGAVRGNLVTDAHIATLMRQHGVSTIWTHDRDFRRFDGVTARDPFGGR